MTEIEIPSEDRHHGGVDQCGDQTPRGPMSTHPNIFDPDNPTFGTGELEGAGDITGDTDTELPANVSNLGCPRCLARGQTWKGDPPRCAFVNGQFIPDNWNCATMNALRRLVEQDTVTNDQHCAVLPLPGEFEPEGDFIVLGWYKSRGSTEYAAVLFEEEMLPLTLKIADEYLREDVIRTTVSDAITLRLDPAVTSSRTQNEMERLDHAEFACKLTAGNASTR